MATNRRSANVFDLVGVVEPTIDAVCCCHDGFRLIRRYLQNCRQNGIAMEVTLDRVNFETVKTLAHRMIESGSMYGFQAITDIGAALERTAECVDKKALVNGSVN